MCVIEASLPPHGAPVTAEEAAAILVRKAQGAFALVGPGPLKLSWVTALDFDYNCGEPGGTAFSPVLSIV